MPALTERVRYLLRNLNPEESADYESVKAAVLTELKLSPAEYLQRFEKAVKRKEETWSQFASRVKTYFSYYLQVREANTFQLAKGVVITASQVAKVLNNKKATLVCKDTAQAIWGMKLLAERSVCGVAAPKARAAEQSPKEPLRSTKVDVVAATVRHWGTIKGEDVSATIANLTKVLPEKIQDARKSTKQLAAISKTE
ncbi:hypothetical protein MTO96_035001 [Rhipicephalus appendiculatus]